jgi:hypothetical protein
MLPSFASTGTTTTTTTTTGGRASSNSFSSTPSPSLLTTTVCVSPRILSFVALTAIAVTTQLAFKLSQNSSTGHYEYNTQSAMTIVELIKLLLSVATLLLWQDTTITQGSSSSTFSAVLESLRTTFQTVPQRVYRHYLLLALSYGVYNQLIFSVMESSIDVGTFSLLKSTTPALVSALNW